MITRLRALGVIVAAGAPWVHAQPGSDGFPQRPISLWVPWPAGGATDLTLRLLDELFARHGLSYIHVPYKGSAEQMVVVASGQVMAGVNSNGFAPYVDAGRLRLLATFGAARTRRWPEVPTLSELGHGIVAMSPYGLAGPRGLAPAVVQTLHDAFRTALLAPAHIAELAKFDQEIARASKKSADQWLSADMSTLTPTSASSPTIWHLRRAQIPSLTVLVN